MHHIEQEMTMRTALIGAKGQLGNDLLPLLGDDVVALGHEDLDITDDSAVAAKLEEIRADLVINAAAYNLVDRAEDEPEIAFAVNALGPRNLAMTCARLGATLLHVSTDYVFGLEGERATPYTETDPPGPVSAYGLSKLAGEYFVRSLCPRHFVVRTCGLYGKAATHGKGNFVETMLRLGAERDSLGVVDDQRCTPSWTVDVAAALVALARTEAYGLYHATSSGSMTWYGFAAEIFAQAGIRIDLRPITTAEFAAPARRPSYSVLDCRKLSRVIGYELTPWRESLGRYLQQRD